MPTIAFDISGDTAASVSLVSLIRQDTNGAVSGVAIPAAFTNTSGGTWEYSFAAPAPNLSYAYTYRIAWGDASHQDVTGTLDDSAVSGSVPPSDRPRFDYIPIIGDATKADLRVAFIGGISTKHGSTDTDAGRLYAEVTKTGPDYLVRIFNDVSRVTDKCVLSGTTQSLGSYFDLIGQNASGMDGKALIASYAQDFRKIILVPTFAVDRDVFTAEDAAKAWPGYDESGVYGLAFLQAQAVKEIMTSGLPGAVPNLFGRTGLSAFVPSAESDALPDIMGLASVDQLRVAQIQLVKALGAEQAEGVERFMAIAKAARGRYDDVMNRLGEINSQDEEEEEELGAESGSDVSFGNWERI